MADTLEREANPPTGRIASPVPQYWNPATGAYEKVSGENGGAHYIDAMEIYGNGVPVFNDEPAGTLYLDVDNDDLYQSTGSAWVLKMEDIWA